MSSFEAWQVGNRPRPEPVPPGTYVAPTEFLPLEPSGPPTLLDMCVPVCPVPFWPPGEWVCPACRTKWRVS